MPNEIPRGYFDIETDPFLRGREPKPFAADVYYESGNGGYHSTWWGNDCAKRLSGVLFNPAHPRIWYAHNGGKFDFHLIVNEIPRKHIKKILCIGGRIVQICFTNGTELRDSFALIPRALREWDKEDIDFKKLEANVRESHKDEIIHYLKKDTEYLSEMVESFHDTYGEHLTLASAAFKILHKEFQVERTRISEPMDARFRAYYFAGRVEFYALGKLEGKYSCVDVNSSFPWSMTQPHWEGDEYITASTLPLRNLAQSFIRLNCLSRGAFPFREEDGSVSFPNDSKEREFYVTGWEFIAARDLGLLAQCRIITTCIPLKTRDYGDYIRHFYNIKQRAEISGNKGERLFAKLLINSGYGKFGMDSRDFEELALCNYREPPDASPEWTILKDDPENGITIYRRPAPGIRHFNNVCVAASITGCSRALLLRALHACKDVVYCDTDSIIARDVSTLKIGNGLGEWKVEHVFDEFHIGGKKLYAGKDEKTQKWKTASKGTKLTSGEIIRVAAGEAVSFEFDAPSYGIRNIKPNAETGATRWLRYTKRTVRRADKMIKRK